MPLGTEVGLSPALC